MKASTAHAKSNRNLRALFLLAAMCLTATWLSHAQSGGGERWVSIGPAATASEPAGRVTCVAIDPSDTNHWYIGGAMGGVWETHNAGDDWKSLTDDQASLAMGALAIARSNPRIVYAGTGEANNNANDGYFGGGLLKSTNGGAGWQLLGTSVFAGNFVSAVVVDPQTPDVLLVATMNELAGVGTYTHKFAWAPQAPPTGIFKSIDGGITWTQTLSGAASALVASPDNFSRQYAGSGDGWIASEIYHWPGSDSNGVYRSFDAGSTWTRIVEAPSVPGRVQVAIAPSDPNIVYVSIANGENLAEVRVTTSAWAKAPSWTALPTVPNPGSAWHYNHAITVDPSDSTRIYLAGQPIWRFDGTSWRSLAGFFEDYHALAWAADRLIACNDGGISSSPSLRVSLVISAQSTPTQAVANLRDYALKHLTE